MLTHSHAEGPVIIRLILVIQKRFHPFSRLKRAVSSR